MTKTDRVTTILAIVGLIADIVTISSVLIIQDLGKSSGLRIEINAWHLFSIWVIGLFTYLGLLRSYWEKYKETEGLDGNFFEFLGFDIFIKFRKPFFLIAFIIFVFLLFWIIPSDARGNAPTFYLILKIIIIIIFAILIGFLIQSYIKKIDKEHFIKDKEKIDQEWSSISAQLSVELEKFPYCGETYIERIGTLFLLNSRMYAAKYIFTKYAHENSSSNIVLGTIFKSGRESTRTIEPWALINHELFSEYYEDSNLDYNYI